MTDDLEEPDARRRRLLVGALSLSGAATALGAGGAAAQSFFGSMPAPLPRGRSVYRLRGSAWVNRIPATLETVIRPGDMVETGKDSEIVFVVGGHSMILRSEGRLQVEGEEESVGSYLLRAMRLIAGKLLTVSRSSRTRLSTPVAAMGIRGTGWYAEAEPDRTYFCTCYGTAEIASAADPQSALVVESQHHDRPVYVLASGAPGERIRDAPFINHTDQELALIEALVGRTPPFVFSGEEYGGVRRDY